MVLPRKPLPPIIRYDSEVGILWKQGEEYGMVLRMEDVVRVWADFGTGVRDRPGNIVQRRPKAKTRTGTTGEVLVNEIT